MKELTISIEREMEDIFLCITNEDMELTFELTDEQFKKLNSNCDHIFEDLMIEEHGLDS